MTLNGRPVHADHNRPASPRTRRSHVALIQRSRTRAERATALVMVPAMALVFIVLAAIALDMTAVAGVQRAAERELAAAVDDAAGMLDGPAHQRDGSIRIDTAAAERVVRARIVAADLPGRVVGLEVVVTDTTVDATARIESPHIFLRSVPGTSDTSLSAPVHVRARLRT